MAWLYGIPDVSFSNHFVYFYSLLSDEDFNPEANTYRGRLRKRQVGLQAQQSFSINMTKLSNATFQINNAVKYIQQVASNERQKELTAARAYCKKMQQAFPFTAEELNENYIINHPEDFYLKLTAVINKARLGTEEYKKELTRILENANGAKHKLHDYFKDDFRYRLYGDTTSLLKKMIGTFREDKRTKDTWNQEVQEAVISITREMIQTRMVKGEDFAAIAVAVLIEIEKRLQNEMDTRRSNGEEVDDFVKLRGEIIDTIKNKYLDELHNNDAQTATQRALLDIQSADFLRITNNVKAVLGITTLEENSRQYQRQINEITKKARQRSNDTRADRSAVTRIQNLLGGSGRSLSNKLRKISIGKLDKRTAHGNMQELSLSLMEQNGYKAGSYAATDILSIECNYEVKPDDDFINGILDSIGKEMSLVLEKEKEKTNANERDLRGAIEQMNQNINKSIRELDKKLKELNENDIGEFFVFHESLKLYSSIETEVYKNWGGNGGFGGREMNILSYIDYMMTGLENAGLSSPLDRDTLIFLALNLSKSAIGEGYEAPLKKYLSIFAGLLMFDDVVNMTKEAMDKEIEKTNVQQVHLYNLNGVYVPASMILSYVGDALAVGASTASYFASININSGAASKAIDTWERRYGQIKSENPHVMLSSKDWQEMGEKVASGTKIKIAFIGAFLQFINKLANLK